MTIQVEKPKITEIQVRMDCNGCVQKIRRALQTVQCIYKVYEDVPQQKIIVVGWADPEKVMRAIKRTGKKAKLCSHKEDEEESNNAEQRADAAAAPPDSATTVTQDPPAEQNNQTVTEGNAAAPAEGAGGDAPPAPPAPAEGGGGGGGDAAPAPAEAAAAPPAASGDAVPQDNKDPQQAQGESGSVTVAAPDEMYWMEAEDNRYSYNNGSNRAWRMTRDDATIFSDENPNACCIS